MLTKIWREWRFPLEFSLLLALAFFLPLREAPKNLLWLAYVVVWLVNRLRSGAWGGRWDGWDTLIVVWLGSGYLAALFAGIRTPDANEWGAVNDLVRNLSLLFLLRRAGYSSTQQIQLLAMLAVSGTLAGMEAWWHWKISHVRRALELVSVGHVNHSAIYLAICTGVLAGLALQKWSAPLRVAVFAAMALLLSLIFMTGSRAAVLAVPLLLVALAVVGGRAAGAARRAWVGLAVLLALSLAIGGWGAVTRQIDNSAANNMLTERDLIWNRALVASAANPLFGVGMDNFSRITDERLQTWLAASGKPYVANDYRRAPHAHNLYLNTLTERGVVGLGVLLAVFAAWGVALARRAPRLASTAGSAGGRAGGGPVGSTRDDSTRGDVSDGRQSGQGVSIALWSASFSAWFITVVIGFANTTLHHEHAMLALIALGIWLAAEPQ